MTITHFNAARKSVCVEALKCVLNSLPQIKATCHGIANHALDMGATCIDIQKELEVYKNIMNNHSENFSKASTLISEIKPMISKIEQCNLEFASSSETLNKSHSQHLEQLQEFQRAMENRPKSEPPMIDYAQIATHLPKPPVIDYAQIASHLPKSEPPVLDYA